MLRVRDELRMTLLAYQTLYESSIAFGIRKALKAEAGKAEMESYISKLELEKTKLDKEVSGGEKDKDTLALVTCFPLQVSDLQVQCQMVEKKAIERRQAEEKAHAEEIDHLKKTSQQLKSQLEGILHKK